MTTSESLLLKPPALKKWTVEQALPFWASTGWDHKRGGFYERLSPDGSPQADALRRLRVQARQIYVYAHAAYLGWYPEGTAIALKAFEVMLKQGRSPDGAPGFVHLLTADGKVSNPLRDSYDHMFVLLATAWLARVSGDEQVRAVLDETLAFVDAELTDGDGSLLEGKPSSLPRRQNPNMHGFEAMMALHESLQYPGALTRAGNYLALFHHHFHDPETGSVREFFDDGWKPLPAPMGTTMEPGHLAEWTWLLRRHETMTGLAPASLATRLLDKAVSTSDPKTGLLVDEADASGAIRRPTSRTWPMTELSKAWLAETEAGRPGARDKAIAALSLMDQHFIQPAPAGCWIDQLDQSGSVISDHITASTFYHVFVAAMEADRVLGSG